MRSIQRSAAPACCGAAGAGAGVRWEPQLGGWAIPYWDRDGGACETSGQLQPGTGCFQVFCPCFPVLVVIASMPL